MYDWIEGFSSRRIDRELAMLQVLRVTVIATMPILFWAGWLVSPELISVANMRYVGAVFALVWGIAFFFLTKTADLSGLSGLSGREQEKLVSRLDHIRLRVWWMGAVALFCAFLVWLIGSLPGADASPLAPLFVGFLVGVGVSYLLVLPGWFREIYAFVDTIRLRTERNKRTESALKQLADGKRAPGGRVASGQ